MQQEASLTDTQIALVKQSWAKVVPIAETASGLFYQRLFESSPHLRPLFRETDMNSQRAKLVKAINMVVGSLERIDTLLPAIRELGMRHVGYGVEERHYEEVGAALLWTLETGLKDRWNEAVEEAWTRAYQVLAAVMVEGANLASNEPSPDGHRGAGHDQIAENPSPVGVEGVEKRPRAA